MAPDGNAAADAPQVRRGRKFDQVLSGARDVFIAHGFEGASVDDIARASGVSKATLYSYFPDKRLLFTEVCSHECARQAEMAMGSINLSDPPRNVLTAIGHHFISFIMSDFGLSIFRMVVAESERFPDLGKQFYESGPLLFRHAMVGYLESAHDRGEVRIDDFAMAAEQFGELCKAGIWIRKTFCPDAAITQTDIDRTVDEAVETWLARYAV